MNLLVAVALALVAAVLLAGLFNLARGGTPERSQALMRWRVVLQFGAILIILGVILLRGG